MDEHEVGGYDVEFVTQPPIDVSCSICTYILRQPIQVNPCGHRFCRSCLVQALRRAFPDVAIERDILNLTIKCANKKCTWTGALRDLERHLDSCSYALVNCSNTNCEVILKRRQIANHLHYCPKRQVRCSYCYEHYIHIDREEHKANCREFIFACRSYWRDKLKYEKTR